MPLSKRFYTVNNEVLGESSFDYIVDGLGNVTGKLSLVDGNIQRYSYKPYGSTVGSPTEPPSFRWVGSWGYRHTNLTGAEYYVRARHYSSKINRWISVDPLWPGQPAYSYVNGRVVTAIDFDGMKEVPLTTISLRALAYKLGISNPMSYVQTTNREVGLALQACFVKVFRGRPNSKIYQSDERFRASGVRDIIPDGVDDIEKFGLFSRKVVCPGVFQEAKATYKTITLRYQRSQAIGYIDWLSKKAKEEDVTTLLMYGTTDDTKVDPAVLSTAWSRKVGFNHWSAVHDTARPSLVYFRLKAASPGVMVGDASKWTCRLSSQRDDLSYDPDPARLDPPDWPSN